MAKRFKTLTDQEIAQAIHGIEDYGCQAKRKPMLTALFTLLANLGLRISEATALRWKDFDFERGEVTVRTLKQQRIRGTSGEWTEDTLPLDRNTMTALLALRNGAEAHELIFPISRKVAYNIFQRLLHLACIRPVKLHALRHSAVTTWVRTGDLAFAMTMARHRSLETTSKYTHCDNLREVFATVKPKG